MKKDKEHARRPRVAPSSDAAKPGVCEPPTVRLLGKIAELVQQPKGSGAVDGNGSKRHP